MDILYFLLLRAQTPLGRETEAIAVRGAEHVGTLFGTSHAA